LVCGSFLEAKAALQREGLATVLPDFLVPEPVAEKFFRVRFSPSDAGEYQYRLAWNPRLLRLNPHAGRRRDFLIDSLAAQMRERRAASRASSMGRRHRVIGYWFESNPGHQMPR
jgi:hypothetical protein